MSAAARPVRRRLAGGARRGPNVAPSPTGRSASAIGRTAVGGVRSVAGDVADRIGAPRPRVRKCGTGSSGDGLPSAVGAAAAAGDPQSAAIESPKEDDEMTDPVPPDAVPTAWLCRCEEITVDEVRAAVAAGARSLNDAKRRTKVGMGPCQGIYCLPAVAAVIGAETGLAADLVTPMTARPPVRPLPLDRLAGPAE